MASDDLLDMMLDDHEKTAASRPRTPEPPPSGSKVPRLRLNQAERTMANALEERRRAEREAELEARREAEARAVRRAEDAPTEMAGFRVGSRFEMSKCAPEVNGVYEVVRIDAGAAGDQSRQLVARRVDGGPGALAFTERKLLDVIHYRVLTRLG
ncbi:MAG: hypothetical protein H6704_26625 [Myxococcales bacterium]|nr:hypothetical protein [Myxococcales bacterium]